MNKRYLIAAAAAAALLSCNGQNGMTDSTALVKLSVLDTKAVSGTDPFQADEIIERTTVYVLEPSASDSSLPGNVVDQACFNGEGPYELETTPGEKFFFLVANGPEPGNPDNYRDIMELEYSMSSMTSAGNSLSRSNGPLMTGLSGKVSVNSTGASTAVRLKRKVFRVNISSVQNCLPQHLEVKILYAFLSNYVSNYTIGNSSAANTVYGNSRGRNNGIINGTDIFSDNGYAAIAKTITIGYMENSSGYDGIGMYALPNPCTADTWSYTSTTERKTRLVLVASLNGKVCYYPIPLDPIGSNRSYDIKLKLYNTGSSDPETPVSKGSLESAINVIDWNTHIEDTNI